MEKEPEIEKSQIPFDVDSLVDSNISEKHKNFHKFFESKDSPDKIIRVESFDELNHKHKNKIPVPELVDITKALYKELEEKYEISVPVDFYVGDNVVYSVVDKIKGNHLEDVDGSKEFFSEIEKQYTSISKYFLEKLKEGGLYLWDINSQDQYVYGKRSGEQENKIYLIDTDIWLANSREGLCLSVYWLTRHMSGLERKAKTQFVDARQCIKQFIDQFNQEFMSDAEKENIEAIKKFLDNEKSDYRPESAIPNFE